LSQPESIIEGARLLREGAVVAIPTDTLYGLAAAIFDERAVESVFEIKRRSREDRVPVLMASAADLPLLCRNVSPTGWALIERFWPGPFTLVLPARRSAPDWITRGRDTVAVRVPAARSTLELLEVLGEPVVGTSANIHRRPPAVTAEQVLGEFEGQIAAVLADDAAIVQGSPSTVAAVSEDRVTILREGMIPLEEIRGAVGPRAVVRANTL